MHNRLHARGTPFSALRHLHYMSCQKYVPILLCPLGKSALSFQERADLPSEYWDLVHHGIGTYF